MVAPSTFRIVISFHNKVYLSSSNPALNTSSDVFVPRSLFQHLPDHNLPVRTVNSNPQLPKYNWARKDYRLGPLRLDWIDFEDPQAQSAEMSAMKAFFTGKEKEGDRRGASVATFVPHARTKSGSTSLPEGIVHFYRDLGRVPSEEQDPPPPAGGQVPDEVTSDGTILAVLAVPSWMTPADFLAFVAPVEDSLKHLRIIRDASPNRSIAVLKFRTKEAATEFGEAYNGQAFNSMEPEICHIVRVSSVQIDPDDTISQALAKLGEGLTEDGQEVKSNMVYELPTCPVCLERMDAAVTGLVTIPCSHTFHCMCLSKWGDSRCPVCRYSQSILQTSPSSSSRSRPIGTSGTGSAPLSQCADCGSTSSLWICLVCGNVGCGRYGRAHAAAHHARTSHPYALELDTQRVWDYARDGYVHRLIQNRADGKLVELPPAAMGEGGAGAGGPTAKDALGAEKLEAIGLEYASLLTSQLESQREWYEGQTAAVSAQAEELRVAAERARELLEEERAKQEEARAHADESDRQRVRAEKRADKLAEVARGLEKELKEERAVSEGLLRNLASLRQAAEDAAAERAALQGRMRELEDQVRDVMFYLEAKSKIEGGEGVVAEAAGGSLEVHSPTPPPAKANGKKKKVKK